MKITAQKTLARPYAKAMFADALHHKTIAAWSGLLQAGSLAVQTPKVVEFLHNPNVSCANKITALINLCEPVMHEAGKRAFKLLAEKKRLNLLPQIAELFEIYRIEKEKTLQVEVTSARELTKEQQEHLIQRLKKRLHQEVILEWKIDANLLGGLVIRAGDLVIDTSVQGKLARLNEVLMD